MANTNTPASAHLGSEKKGQGFTLTELAIVLSIIGLILGAIWGAASMAQERNKKNRAAQELQTIAQNALSVWQGRAIPLTLNTGPGSNGVPGIPGAIPGACGAWNNNATQLAISSNVIPSEMASSPTTATSPWNTVFNIYLPPLVPTHTFRISFYCVPSDACISLLAELTNCQYGASGCPIDVAVASGSVGSWTPANVATSGWRGLDSIAAQELCANNGIPPANNSVEFDYAL